MDKTLTIEISLENAAFGNTLEEARPEVVRILRGMIADLENKGMGSSDNVKLRDSNGNTCGRFFYTP